ncbi:hypothetical protein EMIT0158MI4_30473 [Burkholderia ambifaria]
MADRAELREPRPGDAVAHALVEPRGRIVDEHAQLQFVQPAGARPAQRHVEHVGAGALAAMTGCNLHVADVQRIALLGHAQHADAFAVGFQDEVFGFAPARIEQVAAPDESMALVIAAHVAVRERLGKRKIARLRGPELIQQSQVGRIEHRAGVKNASRHDSAVAGGCNREFLVAAPASGHERKTQMKKPAQGGLLHFLAERTGLEPATPGVTGRYSNQLNYRSSVASCLAGVASCRRIVCSNDAEIWRPLGDSNPCTHRERVMS